MKVFLGGTCNGSSWREEMIPLLTIDYFNPVIDDWNEEAQVREIEERKTSDFVLYTITPNLEGFYSIAEVVDDSNKRPEKTIMLVLTDEGDINYTYHQVKSLKATMKMVYNNGGKTFTNMEECAAYLNSWRLK